MTNSTDPDNGSPVALSPSDSKLVGASTAGIRALTYQLTSFYLRTPVKLFRPTRVDYMAITRLFVNGAQPTQHKEYKFWRDSSLGVLVRAIRRYGWRFFPERVLPPLLANSATGMVLYTSYLLTLQGLQNGSSQVTGGTTSGKGIVEPTIWDTFRAGFIAGAAQSLTAAPIDAIYARSSANEILGGKHENLWKFGFDKLKEVGLRGVFAGYGLSLVKESFGFAVYFSVFEMIKGQWFGAMKRSVLEYRYYKKLMFDPEFHLSKDQYFKNANKEPNFKVMRTCFVFFGGITASLSLLTLQYPLTKFQNIHYSRLEAYDIFNNHTYDSSLLTREQKLNAHKKWFRRYYNTYLDSFEHFVFIQSKSKLSWMDWMYKGFKRHLLGSVPGMVGGLVALEVLRSNLAD